MGAKIFGHVAKGAKNFGRVLGGGGENFISSIFPKSLGKIRDGTRNKIR